MKFDKEHIAFLAGLIDEDEYDVTRYKLAEGLMIDRREFDLKEVSERTVFTELCEPKSHVDEEVLKEGIMDGSWDRKTVVEYLGFDPAPEEVDDEHPEHPERPEGWKYSSHATPGYECDETDPGDRMETLRGKQEQQHWKNQLGIRGPGGQANESRSEFKNVMESLVRKSSVKKDFVKNEVTNIRESNLRSFALNESAEDVTMGFLGLGFGERRNKGYSGYGGEYDSGRFIKPGYTGWDQQIAEMCGAQLTDMGYEEEAELDMSTTGPEIRSIGMGEEFPIEPTMPQSTLSVDIATVPRGPQRKITGFEDDPVAEKTFGHEKETYSPSDDEVDLESVVRNALGESFPNKKNSQEHPEIAWDEDDWEVKDDRGIDGYEPDDDIFDEFYDPYDDPTFLKFDREVKEMQRDKRDDYDSYTDPDFYDLADKHYK